MHEYRVTKYDPSLRDASGAFLGDDWTSISDIGRSFSGVVLTREEYERVERAYIQAALAFLDEGGVGPLTVAELEAPPDHSIGFTEGSQVSADQLGEVLQQILREEVWCNLESHNGFIHFGYDYYMYIGVPHPCPAAERLATDSGLFVERLD